MRDLQRSRRATHAYSQLAAQGFEVFTPMEYILVTVQGKRGRLLVPAFPDMLFVHTTRELLDERVERMPNLQYRYVRGKSPSAPDGVLTVPDLPMRYFMAASNERNNSNPRYYFRSELLPEQVGDRVRVIGGALDGFEGNLLSVRGRGRKVIVGLPNAGIYTRFTLESDVILEKIK